MYESCSQELNVSLCIDFKSMHAYMKPLHFCLEIINVFDQSYLDFSTLSTFQLQFFSTLSICGTWVLVIYKDLVCSMQDTG